MMKLTVQEVEKWSEEEFQNYRLYSYNASHEKKVTKDKIPVWYMYSKNKLIESLKQDEDAK